MENLTKMIIAATMLATPAMADEHGQYSYYLSESCGEFFHNSKYAPWQAIFAEAGVTWNEVVKACGKFGGYTTQYNTSPPDPRGELYRPGRTPMSLGHAIKDATLQKMETK